MKTANILARLLISAISFAGFVSLTACSTPEQTARLSKTATAAFDLWLKRAERDGTLAKTDVADLRELKESALPTATPIAPTK